MYLRDIWYFALPGESLKLGKLIHKVLLDEPLVFGREADGSAFALRDICPHQGVSLSIGRIIDAQKANYGETVIGLMDPAHGPFVHRAWWWRFGASIHEKAKAFAPSELGFAMVEHVPSSNSFAYRILGGKPTTEITFRLPGIRIERISVGAASA